MQKYLFSCYCLKPFLNLLLVITIVSFAACSGGKKSENKSPQQKNQQGWTQLFDGETLNNWKITQFGTQGIVKVSEGNIVLGMGDGCTGITYTGDFPRMNYEVSVEARKVSGNDFFCGMTFPVDSSYCSLIVGGWGGPVVGLSSIDGHDGSDNQTTTLKKFEKDTWYHIRLKVTPEKIEAWVDDEKLIDFATEGHQLSIRPEVLLSRPFGICSWVTTAHLRDLRMKKIEN